jgi:hypothetical protein
MIAPRQHYRKERRDIESPSALQTALALYDMNWGEIEPHYVDRQKILIAELNLPTLNAVEIEEFTQRTRQDNDAYSMFLNAILQASYNAGHNNFNIHEKQPHYTTAHDLQGTPERPFELIIHGNTGDGCIRRNHYLIATIYGNSGHRFAWQNKHSTIHLQGNAGDASVWANEHTNILIGGNAGTEFGLDTTDSTITIHGSITTSGNIVRGLSRTPNYRTTNKETYDRLRKLCCTITLIDP